MTQLAEQVIISNKFTAEKLMLMLDKSMLEVLEKQFALHQEGIIMSAFVWLMDRVMKKNCKNEERYDLLYGLCKMFSEIDINGDKHMEWTEFTQYIIDAVMQKPGTVYYDTDDPHKMSNKTQKFERYNRSKLMDKFIHDGYIQKAIYYPTIDYILCIENVCKEVKMYNPAMKNKIVFSISSTARTIDQDSSNPAKSSQVIKDKIFVMGAAFCERTKFLVASLSDSSFHYWEMQSATNIKYKGSFKSHKPKVIHYNIWYSPIHDNWLSCFEENKLHYLVLWNFSSMINPSVASIAKEPHKEMIMDMCPIESMPKTLVTCSMDKTFKIWIIQGELILKSDLSKTHSYHKTGIRGLDYSSLVGYLVSVGHENFINVWDPQVVINKAFITKLEGHNSAVVNAKFVQSSINLVSVDDRLYIRVWEMKNFTCLQIIFQSMSRLTCQGLLTFSDPTKFCIYGRRIVFFTNLNEDFSLKENKEKDLRPLAIEYNHYSMTFDIVNKTEYRSYDARTGKITRIISDILNPNFEKSEINTFCLDDRNRKFYVGDSSGSIRVYNCTNGILIKTFGLFSEGRANDKDSMLTHHGEVLGLKFIGDDKLLLSIGSDSVLNIFDESKSEECVKLRTICGAHKATEITSIDYSEHLGLLATGGSNGTIAVWDYELSKLEDILYGHSNEICCLKFCEKYPLLISSSSDFNVFIWGVRGANAKSLYTCLCRFVNISKQTNGLNVSTVKSFDVIEMDHRLSKTLRFMDIEVKEVLEGYESVLSDPELKKKVKRPTVSLELEKVKSLMDNNNETKTFDEFYESNEFAQPYLDKTMQFFHPISKPKPEVPHNIFPYVVISDMSGHIKIIELLNVVDINGIVPVVQSHREARGSNFNAKRKENINAAIMASSFEAKHAGSVLPKVAILERFLIEQWCAHKEGIVSLKIMKDSYSIASCSMDSTVKLWSFDAKLYGVISSDIGYSGPWSYPINNTRKQDEEKQELKRVLDEIDDPKKNIDIQFNKIQKQTSAKDEKQAASKQIISEPTRYKGSQIEEIVLEPQDITKKEDNIDEYKVMRITRKT